ncbi:MAG: metallophosphatase family protein [Gemmatales bacterium]|nr:metallophosphatase family protein [Gemmatales bacterium]MDW8385968.1 metallophosphoesterase family protein [Gemmatales bacterium]
MILGILSDTHDRLHRTAQAVHLLKQAGAEVLVHCGDITTPDIVWVCSELPCYYVFGNNDYEQDRLRLAIRESGGICLEWGGTAALDGKRIGIVHGDRLVEERRCLEEKPDYLFCGHTHRCRDDRVGNTRIINPGALSRARVHTVAVLDLHSDRLQFLEI